MSVFPKPLKEIKRIVEMYDNDMIRFHGPWTEERVAEKLPEMQVVMDIHHAHLEVFFEDGHMQVRER